MVGILALVAPSALFKAELDQVKEYQASLAAYQRAQDIYYKEVDNEKLHREKAERALSKVVESQDRIEKLLSERCPDG